MIGSVSASIGGLATAAQRDGNAAESVGPIGTSLPAAAQVDLSAAALQLIASTSNVGVEAATLTSSRDSDRRALDMLA